MGVCIIRLGGFVGDRFSAPLGGSVLQILLRQRCRNCTYLYLSLRIEMLLSVEADRLQVHLWWLGSTANTVSPLQHRITSPRA